MPEVEAVRAFNIAFRDEGLGRPLHSRVMNFGAARYMRQLEPPADALRVETPQWALRQGRRGAREMVDAIAGERRPGDRRPRAARRGARRARLEGDHQPADHRAAGDRRLDGDGRAVLERPRDRAGRRRGERPEGLARRRRRMPIRGEPIELVRVPTRDLFGVLVRRGRASVRRRLPGGRPSTAG